MTDHAEHRSNDEVDGKAYSVTRHGGRALRIVGGETSDGEAEASRPPLTPLVWLFIYGTAPYFAIFATLHWYSPSAVIATVGFWFTAIPLGVALPLAIIGSIYRSFGEDQT